MFFEGVDYWKVKTDVNKLLEDGFTVDLRSWRK
jgi:hypothetical protein